MYLRSTLFVIFSVLLLGINSCAQHEGDSEAELSKEDLALIERMKGASTPEIKLFIREVLDEELPEDYEIPKHIIDAGDPNEATRVIGERYPEFVNKEGSDFLTAIAAHPVRYKLMIQESRALRKHYQEMIYESQQ